MALLIGLTGSFGSGKSTVAGLLRSMGIPVQDADQVARDVVKSGSEGLAEIVKEFGNEVLDENGELDRKKMAARVFSDSEARKKLNGITHPRVRAKQAEFLRDHAASPVIALEIPLLFESGVKGFVGKTLVVTASERVRFGRLRKGGFSEKEIIARLGAQMPQAKKIELADGVVNNDGDLEATRKQVEKILMEWAPGFSIPAETGKTAATA